MKRLNNSTIESQQNLGNLYFTAFQNLPQYTDNVGSFTPLFFSKPSQHLQKQFKVYTQRIKWDSYPMRFVFNARTCRDCFNLFKMSDETIENVLKCSEAIIRSVQGENNASSTDTIIHVSTDFQEKILPMLRKSPIAKLAKIESFAYSGFVHSSNAHKGENRAHLLNGIFVDLLMLGEPAVQMISGSTFALSGVLREGYTTSSKTLHLHSMMTGDFMCRRVYDDKNFYPDSEKVVQKWTAFYE